MERVFRRGNGVLTEYDACVAGALDFEKGGGLQILAPRLPLDLTMHDGSSSLLSFAAIGGVYTLPGYPGFYFLPKALTNPQQRALSLACLRHYIEPPLSQRNVIASPPGGLWLDSLRKNHSGGKVLLHELAWATLGAHYDWKARSYLPSDPSLLANSTATFPPILSGLCRAVAAHVHDALQLSPFVPCHAHAPWGLPMMPFTPHTGIVSFYHPSRSKERLPIAGHKDDADGEDLSAPVVSLSLGATAVFLLGSTSKDVSPTPLLLRGGDVMILSGESRVCVHGVPRVISPLIPPILPPDHDSCEEAGLTRLLSCSRINVTVRQLVRR